jgi:hypothetical protein
MSADPITGHIGSDLKTDHRGQAEAAVGRRAIRRAQHRWRVGSARSRRKNNQPNKIVAHVEAVGPPAAHMRDPLCRFSCKAPH